MSKYYQIFRQKTLLPVIHVQNLDHALRNIEVCLVAGTDGTFLIDHNTPDQPENLLRIAKEIKHRFPNFWVGVNMLGIGLRKIPDFDIQGVDGIWVDDCGINLYSNTLQAEVFWRIIAEWKTMYFGGVSFKYTSGYSADSKVSADLAKLAEPFMDVITTSGPGTGMSAPVDKIKAMKEALHEKPLAIASGVELSNINDYLPWVDSFLVATSINKPGTENLDLHKTTKLAEIIHTAD
jgi:hypothetical protein